MGVFDQLQGGQSQQSSGKSVFQQLQDDNKKKWKNAAENIIEPLKKPVKGLAEIGKALANISVQYQQTPEYKAKLQQQIQEQEAAAAHERSKMAQQFFDPMKNVQKQAESGILGQRAQQISESIPDQDYLDQRREIINSTDPDNPVLKFIKDNTVDRFAMGAERLFSGNVETNIPLLGRVLDPTLNAAGNAANRFSNMGGQAIGVDTIAAGGAAPKTTGNKYADMAADLTGMLAGLSTNPAALEQSLLTGPYQMAQALTASRAGQAVSNAAGNLVQKVNPALNQIGVHLNPNTAMKAANIGLEGATAGAIQNWAVNTAQGKTGLDDMARSALEGAAFGAAGDVVAQGIGKAVNSGLKGVAEKLRPVNETVVTDSKVTPINSIGKKINNQDDMPKDLFPEDTPAEKFKQSWHEQLFGTQGVGITPQFMSTKRNTLTTEGQIVDNPLKNNITGAIETAKASARNVYQNHVDMNSPIKRISKEAYDASIDANRSNQLANVIVTDKFVNPQGEVIGKGLKEIAHQAGRGTFNALEDYLIARHAITRMGRGEKVYDDKLAMTPEKIAERVAQLETMYPEFKQIGKDWDGYFKNVRQVYGVNEDLIPPSLANLLEEQNPNYAPMRRQFTMAEKIKGVGFSGQKPLFSGQSAPLKGVSPVGSTRKIVSPFRSAIEQTGAWVNAAMRNRVMKEIANKISEDPVTMKGIAEIVQPPKGQWNLKEILEKEGEDKYLEMLQEDFNKLFNKTRLDEDNVVRAMVKGEPVYIKVHDVEAVKALAGMGAEQTGLALKIFGTLSNAIKTGATGFLSPLFAAKSVTMDVTQALIQSEAPLKHAGYVVGSVFSSIADTLNIPVLRNMAQDFYRSGGGYSSVLRGERGLNNSVAQLRKDPFLSPQGLWKGLKTTVGVGTLFKPAIKISDIAENMNRIAAYNYKLRQLGERTPENVREAMNYAREITTNYSRKGRQSQLLEAVIPYNNAAVQGMYRFAKAWKQNPIKTAAMVGTLVISPKLYEYAMFHDDPDYQKIPARERYRNIFIRKNADGTFDKVPMPPEYAAIGALTTDMLRAYKDGDPEVFKGVTDSLMNAYTPPAVSGTTQGLTQGGGIEQSIAGLANATSVSPIAAVYGNKSFTGAPIESMKVQDRSPQYRYDERTSGVAKWLGEKLKFSPMKIDYVLKSYGGDPARILLPLTSDVGSGRMQSTIMKNWITDPVFTNTLTDDFYSAKEKLSQAYRDHKEVNAELPKWFSEDMYKLMNSQAKGSISKQLSALNDEKRLVQTDKALTNSEKSQKLREIQAEMNEIYLEAITKVKEAGIPLSNR